MRALFTLALTFSLTTASVALAASKHRPATIRHHQTTETLDYRVRINPGVAAVGKSTIIQVTLSQVLNKKDAALGNLKPINDAKLTGVLVSPGKKGQFLARRAITLRDAGTYGMTFTSDTEGVHALYVTGSSAEAGNIEFSIPVSFGVWPIAEDVKLPNKPRRAPVATTGDIRHGESLCYNYCKKDLDFALPQADTPRFLSSGFAASKTRDELLTAVVGRSTLSRLSPMQKNDLSFYLNDLFMAVKGFFPDAGVVMPAELTINEYGLERLDESLGLKLSPEEQTNTVFVVYRAKDSVDHPSLISFEDRVERGNLKRKDKLGYVVFMKDSKDARFYEVGVALGLEPSYPIVAVKTRAEDGKVQNSLNKQLRSFRGQGRFNDPRSLRRGPRSLQSTILPMYLTAAELATMYYANEREFSEFDTELDID